MKRLLAIGATVLLLASATANAQMMYMYGGVHPIHPAVGGGFCYLGGAHTHSYGVDSNISYLYRNWGGSYYFVGDPYQFGYQGQAFPYYGHHPLPTSFGQTYCYLDGSHYHAFLPAAYQAGLFTVQNGYYYYTGVHPGWYYAYRPSYYRRYHTFWNLPSYVNYYRRYRTYWRTYARPAHVRYFRRPPRMVYRYRTPPRRTVWRASVPAYRYRGYVTARRRAPVRSWTVRRTTTVYRRPSTTVYRRPSRTVYRRPSTTVYRRRSTTVHRRRR